MIPEKYITLINGEIDRTNSPRQTRKLRRLLEKNQEARDLYNDLCALEKKLSVVDDVVPPRHLRQHILNSIPFSRPRPASANILWRELTGWIIRPARPSFGLGIAVGAVATVVVVTGILLFSHRGALDVNHLRGAIMNDHAIAVPTRGGHLEIESPEVRGAAVLARSGEGYMLSILWNAPRKVDALISFESAKEDRSGFLSRGTPVEGVRYEPGRLAFAAAGTLDHEFYIKAEDIRNTRISIACAGVTVFSGMLMPDSTGK